MKATIKIPKGWRRLRKGEIIAIGDRYYCENCHNSEAFWIKYTLSVGAPYNPEWGVSIRRIKRKAAK